MDVEENFIYRDSQRIESSKKDVDNMLFLLLHHFFSYFANKGRTWFRKI